VSSIYNASDQVIAPSNFAMQLLRANGVTRPVTVLSNGVPAAFFDLPRRLHDDGRLTLLSVGRLSGEKHQEVILEAIALSQHREKVSLHVVGTGPRERRLRRQATRLGIDARIGAVSDAELMRLYATADLFIHAGEAELEGMSVLEAMASANVVLLSNSDASAATELITDPRAHFDNRDAATLAATIDHWVDDAKGRAEMARTNRNIALERIHSASVISLARIYRELLNRRDETIISTSHSRTRHNVAMRDIDLTDGRTFARGFPHDTFTTLRREAPVFWQTFPPALLTDHDAGFWVLSRYADVQAANRDVELFCSYDGPSVRIVPEVAGSMLVSMDGREHVRLRRLISAGFTPRMVGRLDEQARKWAVSIVERARERGTCDFVHDVAYQLPMHMIADIVGIPIEDRERLFTLTKELLQGDTAEPERVLSVQAEMFEYAHELAGRKRTEPEDDIWTLLTNVEVESDDGDRTALGEFELDMFFFVLTIAGSETTRNAIAGGLIALLQHPDQLAFLRNNPDAIRQAVEEILRWTSPVAYFARRATRATEIHGVPIAQGDRVTLWYPSANRDEEIFANPHRFDVTRKPNNHIAFGGGGPHHCLGANLARREITIMFEELLTRTTTIEILAPPTYSGLTIDNPVLAAVNELPVRLS
jgi:cholest-4-en-3-one 26-monooxygenase